MPKKQKEIVLSPRYALSFNQKNPHAACFENLCFKQITIESVQKQLKLQNVSDMGPALRDLFCKTPRQEGGWIVKDEHKIWYIDDQLHLQFDSVKKCIERLYSRFGAYLIEQDKKISFVTQDKNNEKVKHYTDYGTLANEKKISIMKWEILLQDILKRDELDFLIQETDSNLIIKTKEKDANLIIETLKKSLGSANCKINLSDTQKSEQKKNAIAFYPEETVSGIKVILKRLFSDAFVKSGLDLDSIFDQTTYMEEGVLFSKEIEHIQLAAMWQSTLNFLRQHFNGVSAERVRFACTQDNQALTHTENSIDSAEHQETAEITEQLKKCLDMKNNTNSTVMISFNYRYFCQLIFSSVIENKNSETKTSEMEVTIPKCDLLSYCLIQLNSQKDKKQDKMCQEVNEYFENLQSNKTDKKILKNMIQYCQNFLIFRTKEEGENQWSDDINSSLILD